MDIRVISCFSEGTGTFSLADQTGTCGFVASAHRELSREGAAWLKELLTQCFSAAHTANGAPSEPGTLVRFFQAVHAGLFGEKQGAALEIGEVSLAAACVVGDMVEVAGAGRCAAYRVTDTEVRRVLAADEGRAEQSGLGTSLKVSMEMVKRAVSDDSVYVLASSSLETEEGWEERLRQAVRSSDSNPENCTAVMFGEPGGALVVLGTDSAVRRLATSESRQETSGVAWYTAIREEVRKGAGALFREERAGQKETIEDEVPAGTEEEASAAGTSTGTSAEPTDSTPERESALLGQPETTLEQTTRTPADLAAETTAAKAEVSPVTQELPEVAPLVEPARVPSGRRTITVPVRGLAFVLAAVALCAAAYGLWAAHGRFVHLFSWVGGRDGRSAEAGAKLTQATLVVGSVPSGAEVIIDNRIMQSRTPVSKVAVSPGTHEVKLRLGELGEWAGNVSLKAGDTADVNVAFIGGISVSSGAKKGLSVFLDDKLRGYTPCLLESIPAGLHVVRVEGEGFSPWREEVVVSYGGISEVEVKPGKLPLTGQVRVTSRVMTEEGFDDAGGAPVFLDGKRVGTTPASVDSKPGLHSVKVGGLQGHSPSVFVIDVRPGGKHFIRAEFGGGEPIVIDCSETRAPGGELMVYASLVNKREAVLSDVSLYLERSGGAQVRWQPMVLVPGSRGVYASVVPESILSGEGPLKYFARARTSEGIDFYSEVRTIQ